MPSHIIFYVLCLFVLGVFGLVGVGFGVFFVQ